MYKVEHGPLCKDKDGCPFDARPCDCWKSGCLIVKSETEKVYVRD